MYVQQWKIKNVYAYPLYFIIEFDNIIKIMSNNTLSISMATEFWQFFHNYIVNLTP